MLAFDVWGSTKCVEIDSNLKWSRMKVPWDYRSYVEASDRDSMTVWSHEYGTDIDTRFSWSERTRSWTRLKGIKEPVSRT